MLVILDMEQLGLVVSDTTNASSRSLITEKDSFEDKQRHIAIVVGHPTGFITVDGWRRLNQWKFPPRNATTAQRSTSDPQQQHRRRTSWRSHDGSAYGPKKHFSDDYNTHDGRHFWSTNMVTPDPSRRNPMIKPLP
uniref:Uncharacterized protein n=1 Tax=Panagrellus redivivus TaxID=6233 RepID=A0A7E4UVL1_PANRE